MRPITFTITGGNGTQTVSNVAPMDHYVSPANIALNVVVTGTITYTVQYTFDDVFAKGYDPTAASSNWNNHPTLVTQVITANSNISYPVTGIRIISPASPASTGTAKLIIIQGGGGGLA
jgi:hypothetical protein